MINRCFRLAVVSLLCVSMAQAELIDEAEQAMRARQFEAAISHLENAKADDYVSYLKAVALYQSGQYAAAVATCETLLEQFPDTEWRHKSRFLMARALIAG